VVPSSLSSSRHRNKAGNRKSRPQHQPVRSTGETQHPGEIFSARVPLCAALASNEDVETIVAKSDGRARTVYIARIYIEQSKVGWTVFDFVDQFCEKASGWGEGPLTSRSPGEHNLARSKIPVAPPERSLLAKPRNQAREELIARRDAGLAVIDQLENPNRSMTTDEVRAVCLQWSEYNLELIGRMFTTDEYRLGYNNATYSPVVMLGGRSYADEKSNAIKIARKKINFIESLAQRLDLIDEEVGVRLQIAPVSTRQKVISQNSLKVFIVHGHDDEAKSIVSRFVEHCGLTPIILHEQADKGRTIIEKFEESSDVSFAIILLTPDDVGAANRDNVNAISDLKPCARQNVILELGYFIGKLGRSRVCALRRGNPELPTDFAGVVYTDYGADEGWKLKLVRELKAANYEIDLNTVLG
jgi:predicted nucleotide-binding protein